MEPWRAVDQWSQILITLMTSSIWIRIKVQSQVLLLINVKSWIRIHVEVLFLQAGSTGREGEATEVWQQQHCRGRHRREPRQSQAVETRLQRAPQPDGRE
jgi:hypothetical protein